MNTGMKRSQMVDQIRRCLTVIMNGKEYDSGNDRFEVKHSQEAAGFILTEIEKAGMLSPCLNLSSGGDFTKEDCQEMADGYEGHFAWYEDSYGEENE